MKKFLVIISCVLLTFTCLGCDAGMVGYERDDSAGDLQIASNEQDQGTVFESISDYMRYYKKLEGSSVTVPGLLDDGYIKEFFLSQEILNISSDRIENFDECPLNSKVYVTGTSCIDENGEPYIDLDYVEYYAALSEPFWSNTTLITTTDEALGVFSTSTTDPNEHYEFTAIVSNNQEYYQLLGLDWEMVLDNRVQDYSVPIGHACQFAVTNVTFDDNGLYFEVEDFIDLEEQ